MERLMLFTLSLLTVIVCVQGYSDTNMLQKFCIDILGQTKADASQCAEKPYSYSLPGSDKAILAYLCCLGAFQDVSINYIQYLSSDFAQYIAGLTSEKDVVDVGLYVQKCQLYATEQSRLTTNDYMSYLASQRTVFDCKV